MDDDSTAVMDAPETSAASAAADGMAGNSASVSEPPPAGPETSVAQQPDSIPPAPPDTSSLSAARPNQPPTAPATPPPSVHASFFDHMLDLLGGKPTTKYVVQNGKVVPDPDQPPPSRKQQIAMMMAGALTGFAAGETERGPGAAGRALAAGGLAGLNLGAERDQAARKEAIADDQRQQAGDSQKQESKLKAAQIFETNQRAMLVRRQAHNLGEETAMKGVTANAPVIAAAHENDVNGQSSVLREHVPYSTIIQEHAQPGARHATSNIYLSDGRVPVMDPKTGQPAMGDDGEPLMEDSAAEIDPAAHVQLSSEALDEAVRTGYAVPGYKPGEAGAKLSMPIMAAAQIAHHNQGYENFKALTGEINSTLALSGDKVLDPDKIIAQAPQLAQAYYQLSSHWDGRPTGFGPALANLAANPKTAPYARTITNAIGGDTLDRYVSTVKGQEKAETDAPEENQKAGFAANKADQSAAASELREQQRQNQKDARTYGSAFDPSSGLRIYTTLAEANSKGLQGFEEMKSGEIQKAKESNRMWNDVQLNTSRYAAAAQAALKTPPTTSDYVNLHTLLNKAGAMDLTAAIGEGGEIKLPGISAITEGLSRETNSEAYHALSPQARALYDGYQRQMTAIPAFQKAMIDMGRTNKETLDLELQFAPNPTWKPQDIAGRIGQFQENIDQGTQGLVKFPDLPHPKELRRQYETAPAAKTRPANDPFTKFGGQSR